MTDVLRIKRRPTGGASGPPATLANAEIAYNEQDNTLYYGKGGTPTAAASIIPVAGSGAFLPLTGGSLTGAVYLPFDPTTPTMAATKQYVDNHAPLGGPYLPIVGGTLTGPLVVNTTTSDTNGQLWIRPPGGANNQISEIRFGGTFGTGVGDVGMRYTASIRSGFVSNAWTYEFLDIWMNNQTNDAQSDANQSLIARFAPNGLVIQKDFSVAGNTVLTGALTAYGNANVGVGTGGYVNLSGASGVPGFVGFYTPGGIRVGYAGWSADGLHLQLETENGYHGWVVSNDPDTPLGIATKQYVDNLPTRAGGPWLPLSGGTLTGILTIGTSAAAQTLAFNGPNNSSRAILWQTAGLNRWLLTSSTNETGSNTGTDLVLVGYNDAGTGQINQALRISRTTGILTLWTDPVQALDAVTKQYVDNHQPLGGPYLPLSGGTVDHLIVSSYLNAPSAGISYDNGGPGGYFKFVWDGTNASMVINGWTGWGAIASQGWVNSVLPVASSTPPPFDGNQVVGTLATFARGDHQHPTQLQFNYVVADTTRTVAASELTAYAFYFYGNNGGATVTLTFPVGTMPIRVWQGMNITDHAIIMAGSGGGTITLPRAGNQEVWTDTSGIYPLNTVTGTPGPGDSSQAVANTYWVSTQFLNLSGGTMTGRLATNSFLDFNNGVATGPQDLSRHIVLWGNTSSGYGFCVTGGTLNYNVVGSASKHDFYAGSSLLFSIQGGNYVWSNLPLSVQGWIGSAGSIGAGTYLSASSGLGNSFTSQGTYLAWNLNNGDGAAHWLNTRGGGSGGFHISSVNPDNTRTDRLFIDGNGVANFYNIVNVGNISLNPASGTTPGYVEFFSPGSGRAGYAGYNDGSNHLMLASGAGFGGWVVDRDPTTAMGIATKQYVDATSSNRGTHGFYTNLAPNAVVRYGADRFFVGAATMWNATTTDTDSTWLAAAYPGFGIYGQSTFASVDNFSMMAVVGASRSTDSKPSNQQVVIGGAFYASNQATTQDVPSWALYTDARRMAGAGDTVAIESDIANLGTFITTNPFNYMPAGSASNLWLGSGSGLTTGQAPTLTIANEAIAIIPNGAKYANGILFANTAINGTDGLTGLGVGIYMANRQSVGWSNNAGNVVAQFYSTTTSASNAGFFYYTDTGLQFGSAPGLPSVVVPVFYNVNASLTLLGGFSTSPPGIGSSANNGSGAMALYLFPQNSGSVFTGGSIMPTADNTLACGIPSNRWTAVYAVNGAIQTSDPSLKTDIADLPSALPLLAAIHPKTFRWKDGGGERVISSVPTDVPVKRKVTKTVLDHVVQSDGSVYLAEVTTESEEDEIDLVPVTLPDGTPVMDQVPLPTPAGRPRRYEARQRMHPVPRTERGVKEVTTFEPRPGRRTHWGFMAPEVKAAFDAIGMDFGGYVLGEDGSHNLRPDQMIPVLWKACQEMAAEIEQLKQRIH